MRPTATQITLVCLFVVCLSVTIVSHAKMLQFEMWILGAQETVSGGVAHWRLD